MKLAISLIRFYKFLFHIPEGIKMELKPMERNGHKTYLVAMTGVLNIRLNRKDSPKVLSLLNDDAHSYKRAHKLYDHDVLSALLKSRHETRDKFDAEDIVYELQWRNPVICKFRGSANYGVITGYERRDRVKFYIYDPLGKIQELTEDNLSDISKIEYWSKSNGRL